jgi:hypothetical protein
MSQLLENIKLLVGRELDPKEIASYTKFQQLNQIDDGDPLITVLALMARSHLMMDTLPEQLADTARKTIELHQQTLREQSTLIAKDLVQSVAQSIQAAAQAAQAADTSWKTRWIRYGVAFGAGSVATAVLIESIRLATR